MSARSNPMPNKASSSENVCKFKEDRVRNNGNSYKYKQRNDNFNSTKQQLGNCSNQAHKKGQFNYQKQPRSRSVWGGKRTKVTSEQREEMGGRKVNLNHLLNFTYEHEETFYSSGRVGFRSKTIARDSVYNKEQFIQSNCQLILKDDGNYSCQLANIDSSVNWDDVETVNIWREEIPTCPICLGDFCAAKMTKCGHIYCWPCILHYLALDEKARRSCPVCHDDIQKKDLRSVRVHKERSVKVQSLISMQLMKRQKDSNLAIPVHQEFEDVNSVKFDEKVSASERRNAKYLLASPNQVLENVVLVEKDQLDFKLATETDEFEQTFIKSALKLCEEREATLRMVMKENKVKVGTEKCGKAGFKADGRSGDFPSDGHGASGTDEAEAKVDDQIVCFYQASDGQHVYLHPLSSRCLIQQYGSYADCPDKISAKILESEEFSMNEETRKRHRYLSHLPLSLEFRIVELDLRPPLVSAEVLATFQQALDRRAGFRRKKARDEKRILRKAHNEAMRKQGKYPAARICLENQQQFPQIQPLQTSGASYSVLFPSPGSTPGSESLVSPTSALEPSSDGSIASSCSENSLSFAQMLKASGSDEQNTWVRRASHPVTSTSIAEERGDSDDDNFAAPPNYQWSVNDALSTAFEGMAPPSGGSSTSGKSKKGKKAKKKVLFSTSGQHH